MYVIMSTISENFFLFLIQESAWYNIRNIKDTVTVQQYIQHRNSIKKQSHIEE